MITTILLSELKDFYPVTDSISQDKINAQMMFVKNNTFIQMFGLKIASKIFNEIIPNSENENFVGFRKFIALCIVNQLIEDAFTHTNVGLKIVNLPNWQTPKTSEKTNTLNKITNTIENQFVEAKKILIDLGEIPNNNFRGYGTFNVVRI